MSIFELYLHLKHILKDRKKRYSEIIGNNGYRTEEK